MLPSVGSCQFCSYSSYFPVSLQLNIMESKYIFCLEQWVYGSFYQVPLINLNYENWAERLREQAVIRITESYVQKSGTDIFQYLSSSHKQQIRSKVQEYRV